MFYVYILESSIDQSYYIGQTIDVNARVLKHNSGSSRSSYTYKKRPWVLIYTEMYSTRTEAIKRENYLKSIKNKEYLKKLLKI